MSAADNVGPGAAVPEDVEKVTAGDPGWNGPTSAGSYGVWTTNASGHKVSALVEFTNGGGVGFYGKTPVGRPTITGSTNGQKVDSIIAALVALGLANDGTS